MNISEFFARCEQSGISILPGKVENGVQVYTLQTSSQTIYIAIHEHRLGVWDGKDWIWKPSEEMLVQLAAMLFAPKLDLQTLLAQLDAILQIARAVELDVREADYAQTHFTQIFSKYQNPTLLFELTINKLELIAQVKTPLLTQNAEPLQIVLQNLNGQIVTIAFDEIQERTAKNVSWQLDARSTLRENGEIITTVRHAKKFLAQIRVIPSSAKYYLAVFDRREEKLDTLTQVMEHLKNAYDTLPLMDFQFSVRQEANLAGVTIASETDPLTGVYHAEIPIKHEMLDVVGIGADARPWKISARGRSASRDFAS